MFFLLQIIFEAKTLIAPRLTKFVEINFYISDNTRSVLESKGIIIEDLIENTGNKLEKALNRQLKNFSKPMEIVFRRHIQQDIPSNIDLDKCYEDPKLLGDHLNTLNLYDAEKSAIAFMNCDPAHYKDSYLTMGNDIAYLTHNLSSQCSSRTLIYVQREKIKLESEIAIAMLRSANVNLNSPIKYEEVDKGDKGVDYEIRPHKQTTEMLATDDCWLSGPEH